MGHCKWIGFHGLRMRARERDASAEKALVQEKGWENRPGYTIALFSTPERKYCLQAEITITKFHVLVNSELRTLEDLHVKAFKKIRKPKIES